MVQRGRKSLASLMVVPIGEKPSASVAATPRHLAKAERELWRQMANELNVTTPTRIALLTAALEAHQIARESRAAVARGRQDRCCWC